MEQKKSLTIANDKRGIRKIISDALEFIKSKVDKNYILSESSPEILKRNKSLILKTVKRNFTYLNKVPDDILLEELQQQSLPIDGIIFTAFERGYILGKSSSKILIGENSKVAILQYIKMQKENSFEPNKLDLNWRFEYVIENLSEDLLSDDDFKKQLLSLLVEKGYKIKENSPTFLKQNVILAERYYRDMLENNNVERLLSSNILNSELLKSEEFLKNYINLLSEKGIDNEIIINTLTHNQECIEVLKRNSKLFQLVFENATPVNLNRFFNRFFNESELNDFLRNQSELTGKLLRLSKLYSKDSSILQSLNGKLLGEQYQNIPDYKLQLIAKNEHFQSQILGLNDYEYSLYSKIATLVSQKTNRWNRFEKNIIENLTDGYYSELIDDLYVQATQGNKITSKDIETLTLLLSKDCSLKSFFDEHLTNGYKNQGMSEEAIKQEEIAYSNNVFNITNKEELGHFEEIKEIVCDTVLTNPSLTDEQLIASIEKYLVKFKQLSELDRMKLALLEKYYNMDLIEATNILKKFSADIGEIDIDDEYQASIVEQIRAIKNIIESDSVDTLRQVGELDILVETDLSSCTYLIEQTKEIFEQMYKKGLYMPKERDKIGSVTFNGENIEVFEAGTDFSMIIKRIGINSNNSQEIWNSMTKEGEYGRKDLRYYTSTSYMTDENIFMRKDDIEVILGFSQGIENNSFDAIYTHDAHTPFYGGDSIYMKANDSCYMLPSTLEMNTDNHYNEIVINTLGIDEDGQMTKMQPDYIVYIKNQDEIESLDGDSLWEKTKKTASEFGVPIVIVNLKKVKEREKAKIIAMSEIIDVDEKESSDLILRFIKKVEHFVSRYGIEDIKEYASRDKMDLLIGYIKEKQQKEKRGISIPYMNTNTAIDQTKSVRQDILSRQAGLKEKGIISGEER